MQATFSSYATPPQPRLPSDGHCDFRMGREGILGLTNRNDEEMIATRTVLIEVRKGVAWEEKEGKRREGGRKAPHKIGHCH